MSVGVHAQHRCLQKLANKRKKSTRNQLHTSPASFSATMAEACVRCSRRLPPNPGPSKLCKRCTARDSACGNSQPLVNLEAPSVNPSAPQPLQPPPAAGAPGKHQPQMPSAKVQVGESSSCTRCSRRLPPDPDVPGLCKRCSSKSSLPQQTRTTSPPKPPERVAPPTAPAALGSTSDGACTRCARRLPAGCTTGLCNRCASGHVREPKAAKPVSGEPPQAPASAPGAPASAAEAKELSRSMKRSPQMRRQARAAKRQGGAANGTPRADSRAARWKERAIKSAEPAGRATTKTTPAGAHQPAGRRPRTEPAPVRFAAHGTDHPRGAPGVCRPSHPPLGGWDRWLGTTLALDLPFVSFGIVGRPLSE